MKWSRPASSPISRPTATCCWSANATTAPARGSSGCAPCSTRPRSNRRRSPRIRETIWSKLLTNMSMSVLCLLTGQTARGVRDDPALRDVIPRLLDEANASARAVSPTSSASPAPGPRPITSRRSCRTTNSAAPMEIDVLVKAPAAFARAAGLSTPMLDMLAALAIRQARDKGLYRGEQIFSSWPGFVPAIHVFLAATLSRRGCPAQGRA